MFHYFWCFLKSSTVFLISCKSYNSDDKFVIVGLCFFSNELVVYFLAVETNVDLYYLGRLNNSKLDFLLPHYLPNLWHIFWWITWHVFTYLRPVIDFKRYFPNRTQKNKKSSLEFNSLLFPRNENFSILEIFTVMPGCYPGLIWWRYTSVPPIHVNFPITSKCVLKVTVHRKKKQWIVLPYFRIFFFKKKLLWYCTSTLYLIN